MASTYVELRRANIARNQAKLRSLGHAAPAPVVAKRRAAPRKRKWLLAATAVGGETTTRPRRSSRLDGKAAVDYKEPCLGWGLVAPPPSLVVPADVVGAGTPTKGEYTEPCKYTSSREALESSAVGTEKACEVRRPAALGASAGTRDITLDLSVLDKQVGGAVAGLGPTGGSKKQAVMHLASPVVPKFSKYSGVQEWCNAIYVFVNVGAGGTYDNAFLEGGRRMTWFAQNRHTLDTPVIRRSLSGHARCKEEGVLSESSSGGGGAGRGKSTKQVTPVFLFLRFAGEDYLVAGRVVPVEHDASCRPLRIVWELVDYERLATVCHFRALVRGR